MHLILDVLEEGEILLRKLFVFHQLDRNCSVFESDEGNTDVLSVLSVESLDQVCLDLIHGLLTLFLNLLCLGDLVLPAAATVIAALLLESLFSAVFCLMDASFFQNIFLAKKLLEPSSFVPGALAVFFSEIFKFHLFLACWYIGVAIFLWLASILVSFHTENTFSY